ncbi:MAG: hypothetical protein MUF18_09975 [Fimbriiglobus sp.]|jgi:hypothetical protein|nr:hypothetical protein [Fimbriiglobus sp.]
MIAVTTFQAYALSRPQGWRAGMYDGTFGEDGLRLLHNGMEILHLTPGTTQVRSSGSALLIALPGGDLELELRPPPPADPRATALAIALALAGGKAKQKVAKERSLGIPWWLNALAVLPVLCDVVLFFSLGRSSWCLTMTGLATMVNVLVVSQSRWDVTRRVAVVGTVAVGSMVAAIVWVSARGFFR